MTIGGLNGNVARVYADILIEFVDHCTTKLGVGAMCVFVARAAFFPPNELKIVLDTSDVGNRSRVRRRHVSLTGITHVASQRHCTVVDIHAHVLTARINVATHCRDNIVLDCLVAAR